MEILLWSLRRRAYGFAEEYIIESIWNNRFPPGSILPLNASFLS